MLVHKISTKLIKFLYHFQKTCKSLKLNQRNVNPLLSFVVQWLENKYLKEKNL